MKIFRKFRQFSLTNNRFGRYLVYALGEIVLVVVGILIALNINNRNEIRKNETLEQLYLHSLKEEYIFNKNLLDSITTYQLESFDSLSVLLDVMGPQEPEISEERFAMLIERSNEMRVFKPNLGVLNEMSSSGKMSLIQNPNLRFSISSFMGSLERVRGFEVSFLEVTQDVRKYKRKHGNIRNAHPIALQYHNLSESRFNTDYADLLQSQEFENLLMAQFYLGRTLYVMHYKKINDETNNIIELINKELEKQ